MTLKELGLSDEEVQDIIASLVASDSNLSWSYDDTNGKLTVSLGSSISVGSLEADTVTDGADVSHSGELADAVDVSPIQSSGDVTVTDTQVGTLADGEFLQNSGGSLVGGTVNVQGAFSNIQVFESDGMFDASNIDFAYVEVVGGGGGGGGEYGGGGGGGAYGAGFIDLSSTTSVAVTVGSGGAGGDEFSSAGSTGETSSFGSFISAEGGFAGSTGPDGRGGGGQTAVGGDINVEGGGGGAGLNASEGSIGGAGGSSVLGGGAHGPTTQSFTHSFDGGNYGGGGSGSSDPSVNGGDGASGVVIVRY